MKKLIRNSRFYVPAMALICSLGFTSCSDDDDNKDITFPVTTHVMYGNYEGKMQTLTVGNNEGEEGEETPSGIDVATKVDSDTIYFDSFPIRDVVVAIVGEELADKIVEAVGEVKYKMGYEAAVNAAQDSIAFKLDPKPLVLAVTIPAEEPVTLNIEVKVSAKSTGSYEITSTNQKFKFGAEEVAFVNGEDKTPIENFKPITFDLEMQKVKSE